MSKNQNNKKRAREDDIVNDDDLDSNGSMDEEDEEDALNLQNGQQNPLGHNSFTTMTTAIKVEQLNQKSTTATNNAVSGTLQDLPEISREIYEDLLTKNESDASGFVRSMRELQNKTFHDKDKLVSLIETKSDGVKLLWKRVKSQTDLKPDLTFPRKPESVVSMFAKDNMKAELLKVEQCFKKDADDPKMKVNEYLHVVVATNGRMKGQLEVRFSKDCCAGSLIPWNGEYSLASELKTADIYEVLMKFHDQKIVLRPDKKGAACYTNDYAGPLPHREANKEKYKDLYNLAMVEVKDHYGRPCK